MSRARGKFHKAVFCPWCGVQGVLRDNYQNDRNSKVEFICPTCGVAYRLSESSRRQAVNRIFAEERRTRVPAKAGDRYKMLCADMFRQIKRHYRVIAKIDTRDAMKAWLDSEQTIAARQEMEAEKRDLQNVD